jgi:protein-tyrosine-phosphatase
MKNRAQLIISIIAISAILLSLNTPDSKMNAKIESLIAQEAMISDERKEELTFLAEMIAQQKQEMGFSKATFVCTHNSRRSQLAQIWFWQALDHFGVENVSAHSGGTEATAFNHRMVKAVKDYGFEMIQLDSLKNPRYVVRGGKAGEREMTLFSKKYGDNFNPQKDFIAVMVCSQADRECPFVPGAYTRVSLPYEDPKSADNTPKEAQAYAEKVEEIGREMLFMVGVIKSLENKG